MTFIFLLSQLLHHWGWFRKWSTNLEARFPIVVKHLILPTTHFLKSNIVLTAPRFVIVLCFVWNDRVWNGLGLLRAPSHHKFLFDGLRFGYWFKYFTSLWELLLGLGDLGSKLLPIALSMANQLRFGLLMSNDDLLANYACRPCLCPKRCFAHVFCEVFVADAPRPVCLRRSLLVCGGQDSGFRWIWLRATLDDQFNFFLNTSRMQRSGALRWNSHNGHEFLGHENGRFAAGLATGLLAVIMTHFLCLHWHCDRG